MVNFKRIAAFVLLFCILLTAFPAYAEDGSWVSAEAAVLYCPDNGQFLYEKNADRFMLIASLTKIMTAVVVLENCKTSDVVCVDSRAVGIEGSSAYLSAGEKFTVLDLLYALLLESANDAAVALALHTSGSIEKFADLMNEKAAELGLAASRFANPHGLDAEEHGSSARDLALLCGYALKNKTFKRITSTKSIRIDDGGGENTHFLINHNRMLSIYDGAIGVKTGYTKASGRCLVSSAERDGVTVIAVTLNAPGDWNDHKVMLDYAFTVLHRVTLPSEETTFDVSVMAGTASCVKAKAAPCDFVFDQNVFPDGGSVYMSKFYYAPVKAGDVLGRIEYKCGGEVVAAVPIVAQTESDAVVYKRKFFDKILEFFR